MSRAPPFPTSSGPSNRLRNQATNNSNGYYQNGTPFPTNVQPLAVQPRSPAYSDSAASAAPTMRSGGSSTGGPARPMRSELRSRQPSQASQSQASSRKGDYRDRERDPAPSRSAGSSGFRDRGQGATMAPVAESTSRQQPPQQYGYGYGSDRMDVSRPSLDGDPYGGYEDTGVNEAYGGYDYNVGATYDYGGPGQPPPVVNSALAAFQKAGARHKNSLDGYEVDERETNRAREREMARDRAQNIPQRGAVDPVTRKARPGDIDGKGAINRKLNDIDVDVLPAILDQIRGEWAFVTEPDFNPVTLALSLLDNTSVGRDLDSFRRTKYLLENSLRGTIDKYYQNFAASLPHHASLHSSLTKVQTEVTDARTRLQETRDALGTKRADLVQLWARGQAVEEMMRLLDEIEHLKAVPDTLESMISEKRLLQAAILLVRSLKTINKGEMLEIGALADLRAYLTGQETALREILVEELQSHLYLKAFWCESRWSPYVPGQQHLPNDREEDVTTLQKPTVIDPSRPVKLTRYLNDLTLRPSNENPYDLAEESDLSKATPGVAFALSSLSINATNATNQTSALSQNPESNSFEYIETLLESLSVLGKLGSGLDTIAQRLPVEIYALVESTIEEIRERSEFGKRSLLSSMATPSGARVSSMYMFLPDPQNHLEPANTLRLMALEAHSGGMDREALKDLFWTLYSKLDAVLQGLRVVYEVSNRIGSRRDFRDSSGAKPGALFPLMEVWTPLQSEIRTLLRDYLTDEERGTGTGRHPIASINEVLREGRVIRDKSRSIFRLGNTDAKTSSKNLRRHEEELMQTLKESVPGLVSGSAEATVQTTLSSSGADDRYAGAGLHSRLIKPDAFHVAVLFQPTLAYLNRVTHVMPHGMSDAARAGIAFLDEFVLKVYLPQLEEKVASLFSHAACGADAFQEDPSSPRLSPKPLVKATTQVMSLINSLCSMHRSTPFHKENYSRLILDIIIRFYQRCYDRFVELVTLPDNHSKNPETRISVSARWAQKGEVTACLSVLLCSQSLDDSVKKRLCRQETRVELNFLTQETIGRGDLIPNAKSISALGTLYHSLTWLIKQLQDLRTTAADVVMSPTEETALSPASEGPVSPVAVVQGPSTHLEKLGLPLTKAMAMRYEALIKTYEQLAELVIHTMRIEVRCRIIHFLDLAIRHGNYQLELEVGEPDPYIIDLNADLGACDDSACTTLVEQDRRFIFEGLGTLMEHLLISNAKHIRFANKYGIQKIFRNILALQQNLKTLSDFPEDAEFARARRYYELFLLTPQQMLESVRKQPQFTFEEYKSMLYLQCGVDQTLGDTRAANNDVNMYLIELHGLVVDDWEDTGVAS